MKSHILIFILIFSVTVFGQAAKQANQPFKSQNVVIKVNDEETTSELLPVPTGFGKGLANAKFGAKYFGPQSESGISIILLLAGTGKTYQPKTDFGIEFLVDEINLNKGKFRLVNNLSDDANYRVLQFIISTEELAWMISGDKLQLKTYNLETQTPLHDVTITPSMMRELIAFSKSILIMRSFFSNSGK